MFFRAPSNTRSRFTAAACAAMLLSLTATASADSVWYENYTNSTHEAAIAEVVAATLGSDDLDPKARTMLAGLIMSSPGETQYSVLDITYPDDTDSNMIVLMIGEDDLTDDDDGWGAVWALEVNLEPRDQLSPYVINSTTLHLAAG